MLKMTQDTKQLVMFLLGQETGEVLRNFRNKTITKKAYDLEMHRLYVSSVEISKIEVTV